MCSVAEGMREYYMRAAPKKAERGDDALAFKMAAASADLRDETAATGPKLRRGRTRPRLLAVSSGGGHWTQLQRLRPAFEGSEVVWLTTQHGHRSSVGDDGFRTVVEANRWQKWKALRCAVGVFVVVVRERPDVIVSTGALPGFFALAFGKLIRAQTIWIDSIANADELSMSGQHAGRVSDLWITQWAHLASPTGPQYFGNVIG